MVVGASESSRRRLRSAYRSLHETGVKERDAITQGGGNARLLMHMNQVEELGVRAVKTTEMAIDATMVLQCAEFAHKMVERHNPDKAVEPRELLRRIRTKYAASVDAVDMLKERPELFHWKKLGEHVESVFTRSSGIGCMIGPIDAAPKNRRIVERRTRDELKPQQQPETVTQNGSAGSRSNANDAVDQEKKMAKVLRTVNEMRGASLPEVLAASTSSTSSAGNFTSAVENLFHLSFLLRDGRAQLSAPRRERKRRRLGSNGHGVSDTVDGLDVDVDDDKENDEEEGALDAPVVTPKGRPTEEDWKTGDATNAAFVFQFDMARYAEWMAAECGAGEQ